MTRRDPVTPEVYEAVRRRDKGCVGPRLHREDPTAFPGPCYGRIELDHVRAGGMGKRSPSVPDNLMTLCAFHHLWKTYNARRARLLQVAWLDRAGGGSGR